VLSKKVGGQSAKNQKHVVRMLRVLCTVALLLLAGTSTASADAEAAVHDILPLALQLLAALLLDPSATRPPVASLSSALAADTAAALLQVSVQLMLRRRIWFGTRQHYHAPRWWHPTGTITSRACVTVQWWPCA
jgi:hypothetical protein